jgi:D-arabinose 1-dehydrogenase-like Zn-dependent alcohol dehydrogenase
VVVPGVDPDAASDSLLASLLTLSDVYLTGYHAAHLARVRPGQTVTVVGDGAVGLSAVLAARTLGAERIILMGRTPTAPTWASSSARPMSSPSAAQRASPRDGPHERRGQPRGDRGGRAHARV